MTGARRMFKQCRIAIGPCRMLSPRPACASTAALAAILIAASSAAADIDPVSGIDFVRITHPGNAPWTGNGQSGDLALGRGRVDYEYSIGRFEVTTSQFVEFCNAAFDRPADDRIPHLSPPTFWGAAATTPNTPGGLRWRVPVGNEMRPVGGISWRMAAIYANWLCNDKSADRSAFMSGAYDVSTFGFGPGFRFTDQQAHTPGARYWIPTWDEMIKASHFDPDRFGEGQPGYWIWNNRTDQFVPFGPPGVGDANYGWHTGPGGISPYSIPLGAYPQTQSPWGLFDLAGATTEWTETVIDADELYRLFEGSYWDSSTGAGVADTIYSAGGELPHINSSQYGLRIASSVPTPTGLGVLLGLWLVSGRRRGEKAECGSHDDVSHSPDYRGRCVRGRQFVGDRSAGRRLG